MDGHPRRGRERQRDIAAYLADERVPAGERGGVMLGLLAHAVVYLLLAGAQAGWCVVTAVRVWRRRDAGLAAAVRDGVHRPTLAGLAVATVAYAVARRLGVAGLSQRASAHATRQAQAADGTTEG